LLFTSLICSLRVSVDLYNLPSNLIKKWFKIEIA
jgi:hypothetical protein